MNLQHSHAIKPFASADLALLKAAAMAAGMTGIEFPRFEGDQGPVYIGQGEYLPIWNPFDNDGDTFRLAVALGMSVCAKFGGWEQGVIGSIAHIKSFDPCFEYHGSDAAAATRRAIVRAASAMPPKGGACPPQ